MPTITAPTGTPPTSPSPAEPAPVDNHLPAPPVSFRAAGRLDRTSAGPFVTLMTSEAATADRIVVVDVAGVELADVAGLRALDRLRQLSDETRAVVLLRGISGARDEVLRADRRLQELRGRPAALTD